MGPNKPVASQLSTTIAGICRHSLCYNCANMVHLAVEPLLRLSVQSQISTEFCPTMDTPALKGNSQ
jgi:hypothetical protein